MIRLFTMNDYEDAYKLWQSTSGVGLRSLDDSKDGIHRFLKRNPSTCFVATENGQVIGSILSGHDGRRGYLYHACVDELHRRKSIGGKLVEHVIEAMNAEKITKLSLVCFAANDVANNFWSSLGWTKRNDLYYYNISINDYNI